MEGIRRASGELGLIMRPVRQATPGAAERGHELDEGEVEEASFLALENMVRAARRLVVLTGAGCSTESGIPAYRDSRGIWCRTAPVMYRAFVESAAVRARYWARSFTGWRHFSCSRPGVSHRALARLQAGGAIHEIITQNVDGLHRSAGSRRVTELHGRLALVKCLDCGSRAMRDGFQARLEAWNPGWSPGAAVIRPDGDAALSNVDYSTFRVPACGRCGGIVKPDVVFFGERVPPRRVERASQAVSGADALLVVGSSLMVFSGFRFVRQAHQAGLPVGAINLGETRADGLLGFKVNAPCGPILSRLAARLGV